MTKRLKKTEALIGVMAISSLSIFANGPAEAVYAPSKILKSEKITGVLNNSANWTNITTQIRYLTDGKFPVEAEAGFSIDPSPMGFNSDFFPHKFPKAPHYKQGSISLESCRSRLTDCNRISIMIYPDMRDRAAVWLEADGAPAWTAATFPLQPGKWNKIFLDIAHLKSAERQRIGKLVIGGTPLGRLPGDPQWQQYYLKDLCFELILPRRIKGWEVSERYVSLSQVGFTPWHKDKKAVFPGTLKADRFRIRNVVANKIRYEGELVELTNSFGTFKLADFSDFKEEGRFFVEAGDTRSATFPITEEPFKNAIEKYLYWLGCMRSGIATPAHPQCFLDDCIREDTKQPVDLTGGWFDASDLRLYNSMSMTNILRPLSIAAAFSPANSTLGQALREEALWGAKFFNKIWDPQTGLPFTMMCVHLPRTDEYKSVQNQYFKNNNYWTDNELNTEDDRVAHTPWNSEYIDGALENYAQHLGICAAAANYLALKQNYASGELNAKILEHTERHFKKLRDEKFRRENQKIIPGVNVDTTASLALSLVIAVLLAELTGKSEYSGSALQAADSLLKRQQQVLIETENGDVVTGFFDKDAPYIPSHINKPVVPVDSLMRLLESKTPVTNYFDYYASIKIYADMYVKKMAGQAEPYSLSVWITRNKTGAARVLGKARAAEKEEFYFGNYAYHSYTIGLESYSVSRLAAFLDDLELQTIAVNLLHWQLGRNPLSQSLLVEVGDDYKPDMMSTVLGFMPGMMSIGFATKDGEPYFPQHHGNNEIYTQLTPYLQALVLANAPCLLRGKITHNGVPVTNKKLRICNHEFNQEFSVVTDNCGEFSNLPLPGGLVYDLDCDNDSLGSFTAISGMEKSVNLDLAGGFEISRVTTPQNVAPESVFEAELAVVCYGKQKQIGEIDVQGYNTTPAEKSRRVTLNPGVNTVKFSFKAPTEASMPYVVMFNKKAQYQNIASAVGIVKP